MEYGQLGQPEGEFSVFFAHIAPDQCSMCVDLDVSADRGNLEPPSLYAVQQRSEDAGRIKRKLGAGETWAFQRRGELSLSARRLVICGWC